ncbi:MAG: DUF2877 domain-containing protein [Candidatus Rokubacteria bacterium]|nr:DUF2877 domain-containing protein [Candidatus Rokubacteria bacterium]
MIPLTALGWKAAAALAHTGGAACVLAALSESVYLTAGDEIVWLGRAGAPMHPRAMLTAAPLSAATGWIEIGRGTTRPWRPPAVSCDAGTARALGAGCRGLVAALAAIGRPDGFGALLADLTPPFPLDAAAGRARALASACAAGDPTAVAAAATELLGLGAGLTPSGDDYVGGAFFARALLARAGACDGAAWGAAGARVLERARERTHPISVALLGDMLDGQAHAPLHDLARALAAGAPRDVALRAVRRLVRIGHSSGWDMLAGFVAGVLGADGLNGAR